MKPLTGNFDKRKALSPFEWRIMALADAMRIEHFISIGPGKTARLAREMSYYSDDERTVALIEPRVECWGGWHKEVLDHFRLVSAPCPRALSGFRYRGPTLIESISSLHYLDYYERLECWRAARAVSREVWLAVSYKSTDTWMLRDGFDDGRQRHFYESMLQLTSELTDTGWAIVDTHERQGDGYEVDGKSSVWFDVIAMGA